MPTGDFGDRLYGVPVPNALAKGMRVLIREGRFEQVGTVLEVQAGEMILVGTKMQRVATDTRPVGSWEAKLVPVSQLQVMPLE